MTVLARTKHVEAARRCLRAGDVGGASRWLDAAFEEPADLAELLLSGPVHEPGEFAPGAAIPNAIVVTVLEDKVIARQDLVPDDYVLVCGPDCYVSHINQYSSGTTQLTIKRERTR